MIGISEHILSQNTRQDLKSERPGCVKTVKGIANLKVEAGDRDMIVDDFMSEVANDNT